MPNQDQLEQYDKLNFDANTYSHLRETAMWARFLGVVGICVSVFIALIAVFASTFLSNLSERNPNPETALLKSFAPLTMIVYLILAGLFFYISYCCYRFGTNTKKALTSNDQLALNESVSNLKILFRVYGIFVIIYLGFIALAVIGGILAYFMN